ncbi:MAG: hypothetical protein IPK78_20790 [Rhodospirillales bacterium]|nr:hypothetical protein [Rhodospirillales bacterium]
MDSTSFAAARLDLDAIEAALRGVQRQFSTINTLLNCRRDSLDDKVVANMMAGYRYVDEALASGADLLAMGNLKHLLELNARVLCGTEPRDRADHAEHLRATEERFYDDQSGGIRDIVEWYRLHRDESVWKRAAGVYVRVLSEPQLYIEGNHRTGALIMSWILASGGRPPFVLTVDNAKEYFDPSSLITRTKRTALAMIYRMPGLKKHFAEFLKAQADAGFLMNPAVAAY